MAHFALIENGFVASVIVIDNADCGNLEFPESEAIGKDFIAALGLGGDWKQTSYNGSFRNAYGVVGSTYDKELDVFIPPVSLTGEVSP